MRRHDLTNKKTKTKEKTFELQHGPRSDCGSVGIITFPVLSIMVYDARANRDEIVPQHSDTSQIISKKFMKFFRPFGVCRRKNSPQNITEELEDGQEFVDRTASKKMS